MEPSDVEPTVQEIPTGNAEEIRQLRVTIPYYGGQDPPKKDEVELFLTHARAHLVQVTLTDVRDRGKSYTLDNNGFQYIHVPSLALVESRIEDYRNPCYLNSHYLPILEHLVIDVIKPKTVIFAGEVIRDIAMFDTADKNKYLKGGQGPFPRPHIDYSTFGSHAMLSNMHRGIYDEYGREQTNTVDKIEKAMQARNQVVRTMEVCAARAGVSIDEWDGSNYDGPRWMIVSLWRPFKTVKRDPLALMDSTTLSIGDLVEMKRWYSTWKGFNKGFDSANFLVRTSTDAILDKGDSKTRHKWCWMSEQTPEDLLMIKLFDSDAQRTDRNVAGASPHVAVKLPGTEGEAVRQSIEIRAYLFW